MKELAAIRPRLVIVASISSYQVFDPLDGQPAQQARIAEIRAEGERRTAQSLLRLADKVVFIADTPRLPDDPANCLLAHPRDEDACRFQLKALVPADRFPVAADSLGSQVNVIDLNRDICGGEACPAVRNGIFLMHDKTHISEATASALSGRFAEILKDAASQR